MSVKQRGNGWQIDFRLADGTRYRKIHPCTSRQEAEFVELKVKKNIRLGRGATTGDMTLEQACDRALKEHYSRLKDSRGAEINVGVLLKVLDPNMLLKDIDGNVLTDLVSDLKTEHGHKGGTINRKLATLQKVMRIAVEQWEVINRLPKFPKQPESVGRVRILTLGEESTLLELLRGLDDIRCSCADFFVFLVDTGCRLSEGLDLQWRDVQLEEGTITIWENKASHPRTVPCTQRVLSCLRGRSAGIGRVFHDVTKDRAERAFRYCRHAMGLADDSQFVVHALRHTCASRLVRAGVELYAVKTLLGHKSITTTERYAHLNTDRLRDAVKVLER